MNQFNLGDEVSVIAPDQEWNGWVGTIERMWLHPIGRHPCYEVIFPRKGRDGLVFLDEQLTLTHPISHYAELR